MDVTLLNVLKALLDPHLEVWATQVHGVALSFLVAAWLWPVLAVLFRRWAHTVPEIEWVQLWRCPECSTFNRRATIICTHCEYHLKIGGWAKWIPLRVSEMYRRSRRRILFVYRLLGSLLFYGLTGTAFWSFQLYAFRQDPMKELLASTALIVLLASLLFFRRALLAWLKSPLNALLDFFAAIVVSGLFVMNLNAWAAIPGQPVKPIPFVKTLFPASIGVLKPAPLPPLPPVKQPKQNKTINKPNK